MPASRKQIDSSTKYSNRNNMLTYGKTSKLRIYTIEERIVSTPSLKHTRAYQHLHGSLNPR